jgi:hypothetical protein
MQISHQTDDWYFLKPFQCCGQKIIHFSMEMGMLNANYHLGTGFYIHKGNISAVKRVEFVSDTMSYI